MSTRRTIPFSQSRTCAQSRTRTSKEDATQKSDRQSIRLASPKGHPVDPSVVTAGGMVSTATSPQEETQRPSPPPQSITFDPYFDGGYSKEQTPQMLPPPLPASHVAGVTQKGTSHEQTKKAPSYVKFNYAHFIDRHYKNMQPGIQRVDYNTKDVFSLCDDAADSFRLQPTMVDVRVPITICGDIHGQFGDLIRMLATLGTPPGERYLFLGDYIDRGPQSLECICLLLAYKVLYPNHVYLLRGNHEQSRINRVYGFYDEMQVRFGRRQGKKVWALFQKVFDQMPVSALVEQRLLCMHGGLSPELHKLAGIRNVPKPISNPMRGLINDLLWGDPCLEVASGWKQSDRGTSFMFGPDIVQLFCNKFNLDMVVRAHQVCLGGYWFFADKKMVTLFSAPAYCNQFNNAAAVMHVSADLICTIKIFQPQPTADASEYELTSANSK